MTKGFEDEGFRPVYAVEWEAQAAATYEENFGPHVVAADITTVPDSEFPEADLVVGGPPCQGFSQLGTRDPADPRNVLWKEYARVVAHVQPQVFVLENVPQFLKSGQFELMQEWTHRGGPLDGYELVSGVLNAADFGVPQRRRRAILIGSRVGTPSLPVPTHGVGRSNSWVGLDVTLAGIAFDTGPSHLRNRNRDDGIPGPFKAEELHLSRNPTAMSLERYDAVPPGGGRFDLPDHLLSPCWVKKKTGTTDVMGRLEWNKPSVTIRTEFFKPEKGRYLHPQYSLADPTDRVNRPITHWEAARIQTFSDDFKWCGTKVEIARQIGNAVPPVFAEAIARHIRITLLEP